MTYSFIKLNFDSLLIKKKKNLAYTYLSSLIACCFLTGSLLSVIQVEMAAHLLIQLTRRQPGPRSTRQTSPTTFLLQWEAFLGCGLKMKLVGGGQCNVFEFSLVSCYPHWNLQKLASCLEFTSCIFPPHSGGLSIFQRSLLVPTSPEPTTHCSSSFPHVSPMPFVSPISW